MKIGVDFGGSHIAIGIIENGIILDKQVYLYINETGNDTLKEKINLAYEYVDKMKKVHNIQSIGISLPGNCKNGILLDARNIKNFNMVNCNIIKNVQDRLNLPVYIENDTLCALIGERKYGALKGYDSAIMFTFGTGVGYSMFFQEDGQEFFLDIEGRNFLDSYAESFEDSLTTLKTLKNVYANEINNYNITRMKIFEDIKQGNKEARILLDMYTKNNCKGIERLHKLTGINTFCIGGGLSEYGELFINEMRDNLPNLNILLANNKNDAGIIGATELQGIRKKNIKFEIK